MSRLAATDLVFLVAENQNRPMHMSSCIVFEPPARQKTHFVNKIVDAFRSAQVASPFNQKLKWLDDGVASWESAEPDMNYHVKHMAIPAPGTTAQLDETLSVLNPPLLDRAYPLWQCFVIEGLEGGRFALFFKIHHAIMDGQGSIKVFRNALSADPNDKDIRPIWLPLRDPPKKKRARVSESQLKRFTRQIRALPSGVMDMTSGLLELGTQTLTAKRSQSSLPFTAPHTPFNVQTISSARSYANCEISLDRIKAIAKTSGCTINDVIMAVIDEALHRYLNERGHGVDRPLVTAMAISTRTDSQGAAGNQVSGDLVAMGQPDATPLQRLEQVHASTSRVKGRVQKMPAPMRQLYSLLLFGVVTLPEVTPGMTAAPSYNLLISNMAGPREKLYLGGAAVIAHRGLPIVPPNPGLNVTFISVHDHICLAVGCTPESMRDPGRYIQLLLQSVDDLERAVIPRKATARKKAVKKTRTAKTTKAKPARTKRKSAGRKS